jgi:tetratricopeptide (TPR) repeat protein
LLGDAHAARGEVVPAHAAYRRAAAATPESAAAHDRLGRLALAARDWEAAKAGFAAARERDARSAGPTYRMGLAFREAGELVAAEQFWQAALESDPTYAPARAALGHLARQRGRLEAAAAHFAAAVRADPALETAQEGLAEVMSARGDRASALYQRGFLALQTDRPYRALGLFRQMAAIAPERVDGPLMTAFAWIQMKQLDRAAEVVGKGLERAPEAPRLLERLATLHVLGRNRPKAKEICAAWQAAAPQAPGSYRLLSRIAREEQRLPEAVRLAEQAVERDVDDAAACYELSRALDAARDSTQAARALEFARRAVERNPREADHWHHLGLLLQAAGRPQDAADAIARALDAGSATPAVGSVLIQLATDLKRPETARFFASLVTALEARRREADTLWRAVYSRPTDAAAQKRLADHLLAYADLTRAHYRLEDVVRLQPADGSARARLASIERLLALRAR